MTNRELARFRGEFIGLKLLLIHCISEVASRHQEPLAFLKGLRDRSVGDVAGARPSDVRRLHVQDFVEGAEAIINQVTATAQAEQVSGASRHRQKKS
jgi:hypothetical protein